MIQNLKERQQPRLPPPSLTIEQVAASDSAHTPQITTGAIPLPRSKLPQRPSDSAAESFRQDRLHDLEWRLRQQEMTSQSTHVQLTQRQSFHQRSYDRADDSRIGYSSTQLCIPPSQESTYRGPAPTIPNFVKPDLRECKAMCYSAEHPASRCFLFT